ncbi:MAG: sulfatase-like hydrolase/transferase [bacterium]|nr:sulfatase-like hydrolase/transferase [bacterium]
MPDTRPNLVFIMTDHQRADSIGSVQAGVEVTPNLNRLAAEGTNFARTYNTCPLCAPARTALATGTYPTVNGIVWNDFDGVNARDFKPMHQYLAEGGYDVAHVGVHHVRVRPSVQERVSFDQWVAEAEYEAHCKASGIDESEFNASSIRFTEILDTADGEQVPTRYSNPMTTVWPHGVEDFKDNFFARHAVDFIREDHDRPFALFVCLWAPHPPLRLPEPYASMFDPAQLDLPPNVDVPADGEPANRRLGAAAQLAEGLSMDEWRRAWAAHLGLVNLADAAVGRILDAIDATGLADTTAVAFTADHGDHLGQHRMYQKMEMYEQAVRVPLIVRVPDGTPSTIPTPISHLDLMPTLLDLAGIESDKPWDGVSLVDAARTGAPPPDRIVFSEFSGNWALGDIRRAAISSRFKYVYDPIDIPELYDLEADPLETVNLAGRPEHAKVQQELHAACQSWHEARGDWVDYDAGA